MLLPRGFHPTPLLPGIRWEAEEHPSARLPWPPSSASSWGSCPSPSPRWVEQPVSSTASFTPSSCLREAIKQETGRTEHRFWLRFPSLWASFPALSVLPSFQPTGSRSLLPFPVSTAHGMVPSPSLPSSSRGPGFPPLRCLLTPENFPPGFCPPPAWWYLQRVLSKGLEDLHPPRVAPGQVAGPHPSGIGGGSPEWDESHQGVGVPWKPHCPCAAGGNGGRLGVTGRQVGVTGE